MRATEQTLSAFFEGAVKYIAPSFQRSYTWRRPEAASLLAAAQDPAAAPRFLGPVVVMDIGCTPDGACKRLLVDGNNRICTLLAFLLAIRDAASAKKLASLAQSIQSAYFLHVRDDGSDFFKYIAPVKNRPAFEALVRSRSPSTPAAPFLRAYRFALQSFSAAAPAALEAATKALSRFTMVVLALERSEDPYPIFKILSPPEQSFTQTALKEYTRFADDPELMALVAGGESRELEFKERLVRPASCPSSTPDPAFGVLRSVAAFMNSTGGGTLLIGVRDDGSIRGVEEEYALADRGKANWDGFQLFLSNRLRTRIVSANTILHYSISKRRAQGHDVCMVRVTPSESPAYIDKRLYVRAANQTVELLGPDLVNFVSRRFPPS